MAKTQEEILTGKLQKKHGEGAAVLLSAGTWSRVTDVCPSGIGVLDHHVLGCGGMPYGRIMEMYGIEGSGKTSLMNKFIAGCQREGGIANLCDAETKFDEGWSKTHGVDPDKLIVSQPAHLEEWLEITENAITQKPASRLMLVALDSVAALPPKRAVDEGLGQDDSVAEAARIWSRAMQLMPKLVSRHGVAMILLNQVRMKIGVMYGNPETTPGGNAIKAYAALRLSVSPGKQTDDKQGRYMNVRAMKNQMHRPFNKAQLKLQYATGFDDRWSTLNHAKDMGCVDAKCRSYKEALKALGWPEPAVPVVDAVDEPDAVVAAVAQDD
jgi:recombination protein RecA